MPKAAILNIERPDQLENVAFKQFSLLFDSLYVNERDFYMGKWDIEKSKLLSSAEKDMILSEIHWMMEKGILKTFIVPKGEQILTTNDSFLLNDIEKIDQRIKENMIPVTDNEEKNPNTGGFRYGGVVQIDNQTLSNVEDIRLRIGAAYLGTKNPLIDFVPVVNSFGSYTKTSSKDLAAHIVLGNIPVPDPAISWEQLLDFKNDADVKRKYYALVNWVNEIAKAELPLHIVVDKYNQLYSEYLHQFNLHNINSKLTKVEMLISYGSEILNLFMTKGVFAAFKGMINVTQKNVALLKEEKNIEGKELSYVFAVNEKFGRNKLVSV